MVLITLENISIEAKDSKIIRNLNAEIESREFVAITGPSGSGKSTLLKFLAQLLSPNLKTSGRYCFQGQDVRDINPLDLRKQVSYCFQSPTLFGTTVRDNLAFPYEIRKVPFDEAKAVLYLTQLSLPATYLDKSITELSGGEKQRVALIRNVLIQPKVLLLDEVTSALDATTREVFWQWLSRYREETGVTIMMISHHEQEQAKADRQIALISRYSAATSGVETKEDHSND